jgi:hypothetical protein
VVALIVTGGQEQGAIAAAGLIVAMVLAPVLLGLLWRLRDRRSRRDRDG